MSGNLLGLSSNAFGGPLGVPAAFLPGMSLFQNAFQIAINRIIW